MLFLSRQDPAELSQILLVLNFDDDDDVAYDAYDAYDDDVVVVVDDDDDYDDWLTYLPTLFLGLFGKKIHSLNRA